MEVHLKNQQLISKCQQKHTNMVHLACQCDYACTHTHTHTYMPTHMSPCLCHAFTAIVQTHAYIPTHMSPCLCHTFTAIVQKGSFVYKYSFTCVQTVLHMPFTIMLIADQIVCFWTDNTIWGRNKIVNSAYLFFVSQIVLIFFIQLLMNINIIRGVCIYREIQNWTTSINN